MVIVQEGIANFSKTGDTLEAAGYRVERIEEGGDWRLRLAELDLVAAGQGPMFPGTRPPVFIFCSLQVAGQVERCHADLARGLWLDADWMRFSSWSGGLPGDMLLNRSFILLPFGHLSQRKEQIRTMFGNRIFLRPDSGRKEFPGIVIDLDEFEREISSMRQAWHAQDDLLVVVDAAREIAPHEYRFWISEGEIITHAPYTPMPDEDGKLGPAPACPPEISDLALRVARHMSISERPIVADLVMEGKTARLVEINAMSTSGHYDGMDPVALIEAIFSLYPRHSFA